MALGMLHAAHAAAADTLDSPKLEQIEFRELLLNDAIRLLAEQTGINVAASAEAGKIQVSLFLRNVTAKAAIEMLCKSNNLWYKLDEGTGIYRIMTTTEFQRDLVSFREEKTEVFTLMYPNALAAALAVRDLFGDRVQLTLNRQETSDETTDLTSRFDRFDIVDQRSQSLGLFQSGGTTVTGGGGGSNSFSGGSNNSLSARSNQNDVGNSSFTRRSDILRQNTENQKTGEFQNLTPEQAQSLQRALDTNGNSGAVAQAYVESLRRSATNIFVTLSRRNNTVMVRTSDQKALEEIKTLIERIDVPTATVLLEVKVLSIDLGDDFNSAFDYQFTDGINNAGGFNVGDIQPPSADLLKGLARKTAPLALSGTGLQSGNLAYQFVNNNFRARLQLLQTKNRVTTLATPLLMTANNEVSRLFVGEERPIIRNISSQTVVNNNAVTSTPNTTVEFRPVGTTLLITPNINSDHTVTLRILQENSQIVPGAANIPVVNGNGDVKQQPVDVVATRTVSGTVVAKDNLCLAVGGLIEDTVMDQRSQVPGIGKVPVIGFFFRKQSTGRTRKELVVVIRPHILSTPCEAEGISKSLIRDLSIHPNATNLEGTMDAFLPREVLVPHPPKDKKADVINIDNVKTNE